MFFSQYLNVTRLWLQISNLPAIITRFVGQTADLENDDLGRIGS